MVLKYFMNLPWQILILESGLNVNPVIRVVWFLRLGFIGSLDHSLIAKESKQKLKSFISCAKLHKVMLLLLVVGSSSLNALAPGQSHFKSHF